jgi:hypothetical protein
VLVQALEILPPDAYVPCLGQTITIIKKKAGGKKRLPDIKDAIEEEQEDLKQWEGGLDGVVGWEEWRALIATFERALMWLPKVRYQLSYSSSLMLNPTMFMYPAKHLSPQLAQVPHRARKCNALPA